MTRYFNTTGPCDPRRHYMLPPSDRLIGAQLRRYIQDELYWVLHAPRQTGKTTFLQSWMRQINAAQDVPMSGMRQDGASCPIDSGNAVACYVSVESCQGLTSIEQAMPTAVSSIIDFARAFLPAECVPARSDADCGSLLGRILSDWAAQVAPRALIVLFDEVDVLQDQAMVSFLRQLRSGFARRGVGKFPVSVALVGMRDLRDYLIESKDGVAVNPGSPFNIKQDSVSLSNFSRADVGKLLAQHTEETEQPFEPSAVELVYEFTCGQPWLVNAIAQKCAWNLVPLESRAKITDDHIRQAKELLISDRAVHLDSLGERLKDSRVKRVVESIMVGESDPQIAEGDDFRLCIDLGLVTVENGTPQIANPIYREVIPRVLNQGMQYAIPQPGFVWQRPDGTLDMPALLKNFQAFWRRNSDTWEQKADYTEAFPHLLLMAFLQRVTNGGGRIDREYAAGRGRVDLAVEFGGAWSVIEIKLVHPQDGRETTILEGLEQTAAYRDRVDPRADAFLVVFDRRPEARARTWEERLTWETRTTQTFDPARPVTIIGA